MWFILMQKDHLDIFKNKAAVCLKVTEQKLFFFLIAHVQGIAFHYFVGEQEWVQKGYLSKLEMQ